MADQDIEIQEQDQPMPSTSNAAAAGHEDVAHYMDMFGAPRAFDTLKLPTNADLLRRIFLAYNLILTTEKIRKPLISFCSIVADEIVNIWQQTTIPIIETSSVRVKVRRFIEHYQKAIKNQGHLEAFGEFIDETQHLFDIAKCHCMNLCKCHKSADKIPTAVRGFLFDQRGARLLSLIVAEHRDDGDGNGGCGI